MNTTDNDHHYYLSETHMDQAFMDNLAKQLGIPKDVQDTLDAGSAHPFTCRCDTCRKWWKAMGPQNMDESALPSFVPDYGPFSREEIEGVS